MLLKANIELYHTQSESFNGFSDKIKDASVRHKPYLPQHLICTILNLFWMTF